MVRIDPVVVRHDDVHIPLKVLNKIQVIFSKSKPLKDPQICTFKTCPELTFIIRNILIFHSHFAIFFFLQEDNKEHKSLSSQFFFFLSFLAVRPSVLPSVSSFLHIDTFFYQASVIQPVPYK